MNEKDVIEKRIKENLKLGNSLGSIKKHLIKVYNKELIDDIIKKYNKKERLKKFLIEAGKGEGVRRFFLIVMGFLLTLIVLELSLRIGGVIISSEQNALNKITGFSVSEQQNVYRILALGESTTAGGVNSWPSQLEKVLNQKNPGIKFKVYNEGVGGTSTAFILSRLNKNLERYNPDMVITMMGINDRGRLVYKGNLNIKWTLFLRDFRLYKLSKWLMYSWKNKITSWKNKINFEENQLIDEIMDRYVTAENITLRQQGRLREAENVLNDVLKVKEDHTAYAELGFVYYDLGELEKAEQMFKKSIEISPTKNRPAYYGLEESSRLRNISHDEIKEFYNEHGYEFDINTDPDFETTEYHFRLMFSILNEKGIKFVVVQYPTLDISKLKGIFNGDEDIIFVSNEENFKEALKNARYEDYFTDHFGHSFGHATPAGNRLIAENVADTLEEYDYIK